MSLIDVLKEVPDFRKSRGQRHPLWVVLVMMIMGNLAGYHGNRPLGEFAQRYGAQIAQLLEVELPSVPSYSTFRRVSNGLDFMALSHGFSQWMRTHLSLDEVAYAVDGKRICQPIDGDDGKTRFVGLVSVFGHHQGISAAVAAMSEQENSELTVVQQLMEALGLRGVLLSLDALHTQKNAQGHP